MLFNIQHHVILGTALRKTQICLFVVGSQGKEARVEACREEDLAVNSLRTGPRARSNGNDVGELPA